MNIEKLIRSEDGEASTTRVSLSSGTVQHSKEKSIGTKATLTRMGVYLCLISMMRGVTLTIRCSGKGGQENKGSAMMNADKCNDAALKIQPPKTHALLALPMYFNTGNGVLELYHPFGTSFSDMRQHEALY